AITGGSNVGFDYTGVAAYVKYQATPKYAFAGRYEFLNDHDGLALGFNGGLACPYPDESCATNPNGIPLFAHNHPQEFTVTAERTFASHLISRLEYRYDYSNQNMYELGGGKGYGTGTDNQSTVDIGLIYVL